MQIDKNDNHWGVYCQMNAEFPDDECWDDCVLEGYSKAYASDLVKAFNTGASPMHKKARLIYIFY